MLFWGTHPGSFSCGCSARGTRSSRAGISCQCFGRVGKGVPGGPRGVTRRAEPIAAKDREKMRIMHSSAAALFVTIAGLTTTASAQQSPFNTNGTGPFINFGDNSPVPIEPRYAPSAFLGNDAASIANTDATLAAAQAQGKPLAVKVVQPLTNAAALAIFNKYAVQFVFCDYEDAARVGRTRAIADQVLHSTKSKNAYVGNFNS